MSETALPVLSTMVTTPEPTSGTLPTGDWLAMLLTCVPRPLTAPPVLLRMVPVVRVVDGVPLPEPLPLPFPFPLPLPLPLPEPFPAVTPPSPVVVPVPLPVVVDPLPAVVPSLPDVEPSPVVEAPVVAVFAVVDEPPPPLPLHEARDRATRIAKAILLTLPT